MRITRDEAEAFFAHPTQRVMGLEELPGEPFQYYAQGRVCLVLHHSFWPDIWMAHVGMKPEGWGKSDADTLSILRDFWAEHEPCRITAWISEKNKAALAFARRLGFQEDGRLPGVRMLGWEI